MGLIPKQPPTTDVVIDGDIYTIKTMLTFFEREQTSPMQSFKLQMPYGKLERNDIRPEDMMDVVPDGAVHKLRKLKMWLVKWSHSDNLNSENLRRLHPRHAQILLERIEELEKEQDGASEDSPLVMFSNQ